MVSKPSGWVIFQYVMASLFVILSLARLFDDDIAGWFAEDRDDLNPHVTIDTPLSVWDIETCVNDTRVVGLGLQYGRQGPRRFLWTDENGVNFQVNSLTNLARDTRLDIVDFGDYRQVDFFQPVGREMREGEKSHLEECLELEELPAS